MDNARDCRQLTLFGEEVPLEQPEILRDRNGYYLPGISGNPSGKGKNTREEREALEEIKKLAPGIVGKMAALLDDGETPANVKVRIMEAQPVCDHRRHLQQGRPGIPGGAGADKAAVR